MSANMREYNQRVIAEFRANGGKVGGQLANAALLLLTTVGAKSNQPRVAPLGYWEEGGRYIVLASMMGAPHHPAWYHNLVANPDVTVEVGGERFPARAHAATGEGRERLTTFLAARTSLLADHQGRTSRQIPIVVLERA
jgi:deazaflavin-dependent oxidoreductase (nitroreductase family)